MQLWFLERNVIYIPLLISCMFAQLAKAWCFFFLFTFLFFFHLLMSGSFGQTETCFWAKKEREHWCITAMSCWQPQVCSGQVYSDGVLSAAGYIWKRDRYEEDIERLRDVTGAGIVKLENERLPERERHLEGQQERRVQREAEKESRARWRYVQSSEEGCGCFVSSYRLRVICLPQLCHPAVTHCYAPLCPGILAHTSLCPPSSACVWVCMCVCTHSHLSVLAVKDYMHWNEQILFFFFLMRSEPINKSLQALCTRFQESWHSLKLSPNMLLCLLICLFSLYMMEVFFSRQSWNCSAVISQWKPCASSRHQTNLQSPLPLPPPQPRRVRGLNYPEHITANSHFAANHLWLKLWEALAAAWLLRGEEQPKPWAGQPTID